MQIKKNIKYIIYILLFISIFYYLYYNFYLINNFNIKNSIITNLKILLNKDNHRTEHYNNDYNVKFLPESQFLRINLKKIKLNFLPQHPDTKSKKYPFYIDFFKDNLVITDFKGKIYTKNIDLLNNEKLNFRNIPSNLDIDYALDLMILKNMIYISAVKRDNQCLNLYLYYAEFNFNKIKFKKLFDSKNEECIKDGFSSGKIQATKVNNEDLILLSVSTIFNNDDVNFSTLKPIQDDNIFGKILIIDQKTHKYEYYAKGFRNILGLFADKDIILATDNGPKGGDEINKVIKNQNYGWPISSYGEKYFKKYEDSSINYKKNHEDNDFQEPIFAFVPSIGISQIIRLPNNFSEQWHDNFLIATLNDKHLLRVKFDNNFSKILYIEKIFINERIRDLKYSKKNNFIILALESSGSLGILSKIK